MKTKIFHSMFLALSISFLFIWMMIPISASDRETIIGGINILKTDVFSRGLSGAGYQVAREATSEELRDSSVSKRLLRTEEEILTVVYTSFWNNKKMEGAKVAEVVTGTNGSAAIYGLPYGTYYLVETIAPDGYNRMSAPVRFTVNKYSHLTVSDDVRDDEDTIIDNTLHIITIRYGLQDAANAVSKQIIVSLMVSPLSVALLIKLIQIRNRSVA